MIGSAFFAKTIVATALAAALVAPLASSAGEVSNRVHDQQARIHQGVASGQLTAREYANTEARLHSINAQRRADLHANGGHLTPAERHNLNARLNANSRNIYFKKHNLRDQPGV